MPQLSRLRRLDMHAPIALKQLETVAEFFAMNAARGSDRFVVAGTVEILGTGGLAGAIEEIAAIDRHGAPFLPARHRMLGAIS